MTTIPFIETRSFNPNEGRFELADRFRRHLCRLRCKRLPPERLAPPDDGDIPDVDPMDAIGISADDATRIKRILELRKAASGLEHLKRDDRERLEVLKHGARLVQISS